MNTTHSSEIKGQKSGRSHQNRSQKARTQNRTSDSASPLPGDVTQNEKLLQRKVETVPR